MQSQIHVKDQGFAADLTLLSFHYTSLKIYLLVLCDGSIKQPNFPNQSTINHTITGNIVD